MPGEGVAPHLTDQALAARLLTMKRDIRFFTKGEREAFLAEAARRLIMVTRDQFERGYAERSGVTVAELHSYGRHAVPCYCAEDVCEGWQMVNTTEGGSDADHIR